MAFHIMAVHIFEKAHNFVKSTYMAVFLSHRKSLRRVNKSTQSGELHYSFRE